MQDLKTRLEDMRKRVRDLQEEVEVDPDNLDLEWSYFAERYLSVLTALSEAKALERDAKAQFEDLKARLYQSIAEDMKARGERVTEAAIQSALTVHPEYATAVSLKNEIDLAVSQASDLSWAMSAKKTALENLVTLWGNKYFCGPKEPLDLSSRYMLSKREKTNDLIKSKMKKRKGEA